MNYTADRHEQEKSDMLGEFNKAIADAEARRKEAAERSDDGAAPAGEIPDEKGDDAAAAGCARAIPQSGEAAVTAGAVGDSDPDGPRAA